MKPIVAAYAGRDLVDRLDGIDVEDGQVLRLAWPDGTTTVEPVRVRSYGLRHGVQREAYVLRPHGAVWLRLASLDRGLVAERVALPIALKGAA